MLVIEFSLHPVRFGQLWLLGSLQGPTRAHVASLAW
jgi:hypothetical protein